MAEFYSDSIENVIANYGDMVYRIAFSMVKNKSDADDIFQEVFLKYIKQVDTYNFNDEEHLKKWLIKVCINCGKDVVSSSWSKHISLDDYEDYGDKQNSNYNHSKIENISEDFALEDNVQISVDLKRALDDIPAKYRTIIYLYYFENMSVKDVASAMGSNSAMVRVHLSRARKLLKDRLGGEYSFE